MAIEQSFIPIGDTGAKLDSVQVDTPAGTDLHRETVVVADPENPAGLAKVTNAPPAPDVYAGAVREVQTPVLTRPHQNATVGQTLVKMPTTGKKLRLTWYALQAGADNSGTVQAGLRFGLLGDNIHTWSLSRFGGVVAHSFKSGDGYVEGAVDQGLYLDQNAAQLVLTNIDFEEV